RSSSCTSRRSTASIASWTRRRSCTTSGRSRRLAWPKRVAAPESGARASVDNATVAIGRFTVAIRFVGSGGSDVLTGVRVLDLTDERGAFAAYLLAGLGADVVAVEPPEGSGARRAPPFDHTGRSLFWAAFGRGKRSVVAELGTPAGAQKLIELVRDADVVIESADPGSMEALG